jgi:hypothetical protein
MLSSVSDCGIASRGSDPMHKTSVWCLATSPSSPDLAVLTAPAQRAGRQADRDPDEDGHRRGRRPRARRHRRGPVGQEFQDPVICCHGAEPTRDARLHEWLIDRVEQLSELICYPRRPGRDSSVVEQLFRKSPALCAVLPEWRPDTNGHTHQLLVSRGCPPRIDAASRLRQNRPWTPGIVVRSSKQPSLTSMPCLASRSLWAAAEGP